MFPATVSFSPLQAPTVTITDSNELIPVTVTIEPVIGSLVTGWFTDAITLSAAVHITANVVVDTVPDRGGTANGPPSHNDSTDYSLIELSIP